MSQDLALRCPTSAGLLSHTLARRLGSGFEILLPILLEFFSALMEQCFDDEPEFLDRAKSLNRWNVRQLATLYRRALRQANIGSPRTRVGKAKAAASDIAEMCDEARESDLGTCYRELMAA